MRSIHVTMNVTLDGVVQGLGRPDEDTRGGFAHGGWGTRYQDDVLAQEMAAGMAAPVTCSSAAGPGKTSSVPGRTAKTATPSPPT